MSILNARLKGEEQDPQGNITPLRRDLALRELGPILRVTLLPLEVQLKFYSSKNVPTPDPITGNALIDTGASVTCIDQSAAQKAGLPVVDSSPISSATHSNAVVPIYAGRLMIQNLHQNIESKRAYGVNLDSQGLIALIGRDLLASCIFIYNGPDSSFSLSI